jgi:hypothetical protein
MTVTSTKPPAKANDAREKPAPKSNEQRARAKEDATARKRSLRIAVDVAIEQIDDIIEALAREQGIGFTQACNYVHLGGRVFKGRRRPTIQNAYRFCWARVEDGRCMYINRFIATFVLTPLFPGTEADGGQIAEAVRIINDTKNNSDEYKTLSQDDQETLIMLLQEDRDQKETGVVGKPQLRLHDIRTTMEKVHIEVCSLSLHTDFSSSF